MNGLECMAEVSVHYKFLFTKETTNIPVVHTDLERHLQ